MAEYRTVKMSFWTDPYIEELPSDGKLLYMYLFTCPYTNNLGVVETTLRRIGYETGIDQKRITVLMGNMEKSGKIIRDGNFYWLTRFMKHQCSTSPKLLISLKAMLQEVPSVKIRYAICKQYPSIFECPEEELTDMETILSEDDGSNIPYANGTDTVSIPSGEIGSGKLEVGSLNLEGGINARGRAKPSRPKKQSYGQFQQVQLTEEEHDSLVEQVGQTEADRWIAKLDTHMASTGKRYKNHLATMLKWKQHDDEEKEEKAQAQPQRQWISEAERRQMKNNEVCRQVAEEIANGGGPF